MRLRRVILSAGSVIAGLLLAGADVAPALAAGPGVTLVASNANPRPGASVDLTASSEQPVPQGYFLQIVDQRSRGTTAAPGTSAAGPGVQRSCPGTPCVVTVSASVPPTPRTFFARVSLMSGGDVKGESAPLIVTWSASPPATAPAVPPSKPSPPVARSRALCPEAFAHFDRDQIEGAGLKDTARTGMHFDGDELAAQFQAAIKEYDQRRPAARSYVSGNLGTPLGAAAWLFSEGGTLPNVPGVGSAAFVTGDERKLYDAVKALSKSRQAQGGAPLLTPGDVFSLALELSDGDAEKAMLTAHNTVRSQARNDATVTEQTGLTRDPQFMESYLVRVRDSSDNAGPWYHMFGTAYFEIVSKGDWGPWAAFGASSALLLSGAATGGGSIAGLALLTGVYGGLEMTGSQGTVNLSQLANAVEQAYRHNVSGRTPDPEKYCFNVWGAQIGRLLYPNLPSKTTRDVRRFFSSFSRPAAATETPGVDLKAARFITVMGSPFSVQWKASGTTLVFDQGDDPAQATLVESAPVVAFPVREATSWGLAWIDGDQTEVTFEAMSARAVLHLVRLDTTTGRAVGYEATASAKGERLSATFDEVTAAPRLFRADGTEVKPVTLDVAAKESWRPPVWIAIGATALVLVLGGSVLAVLRRRRAP